MNKVKMFFDYACPFCLRGYESLMELLPNYSNLEMEFHLCEARPRPEEGYGYHSDLLIRAMFYAVNSGVEISLFNKRAFELYHEDEANVEDINVLVKGFKDILDADELKKMLISGKYEAELQNANDYAYKQSGVWIIPDFRAGSLKLAAEAGTDLSKEGIRDFLDKCAKL